APVTMMNKTAYAMMLLSIEVLRNLKGHAGQFAQFGGIMEPIGGNLHPVLRSANYLGLPEDSQPPINTRLQPSDRLGADGAQVGNKLPKFHASVSGISPIPTVETILQMA